MDHHGRLLVGRLLVLLYYLLTMTVVVAAAIVRDLPPHNPNNSGVGMTTMSRRTFIIGSTLACALWTGNNDEDTAAATVMGDMPVSSSSPSSSATTIAAAPHSTSSHSTTFPSFFQKFDTAGEIPARCFTEQKVLYGLVERVIDGDTIRVTHVPGFGTGFFSTKQPSPISDNKGIAHRTMSIRIYAVDCPELAKNKRQTSMPCGAEAKQFTSDLVLHNMVKLRLLRRDQYNRAVCVVETVPSRRRFFPFLRRRPTDLSMALAKAGLAELYTGGGAEYYHQRDAFERAIATAQRRKLGIHSGANRQSAADFKQQQKQQATSQTGARVRAGSRPVPVSKAKKAQRQKQQQQPLVLMARTGLENKKSITRNKAAFVASSSGTSKHQRQTLPSHNHRENLMDAVITGLEFVG